MPSYKGKKLTQYAAKQGGKNQSSVDGFYKDKHGKRYFVKKPADSKELFTELFAGLILQEFIAEGLIEAKYSSSLIFADLLQFDDNTYGLIQPCIEFDELHKIINTSSKNGKDRSSLAETLFGPTSYATLTKTRSFGLSIALMFSLLLGAHSVHSGNIVVLRKNKAIRQYARIDWGDAFRYLAHPENNDDLLYAYENRGINYKHLTKDYFLNYRAIQGIFPAIAQKAQELTEKLPSHYLTKIIIKALKRIPADLLDPQTQKALADYMCIPSFATVHFGKQEQGYQTFAQDIAEVLERRIHKMTKLKDLNAPSQNSLYESQNITQSFAVSETDTFLTIAKRLDVAANTLDYRTLDVQPLIKKYNEYLDKIAKDCELYNLWDHDYAHSTNLLVPFYQGNGQDELGHAFVGQYKESTVLRHLYGYDPVHQNSLRFRPFERPSIDYIKKHPNSLWQLVTETAQAGTMILSTLKQSKRKLEAEIEIEPATLQGFIRNFLAMAEQFEQRLQPVRALCIERAKESNFFYPISLEALKTMTADQLTTICLEELNAEQFSPLVLRIVQTDELWAKVEIGLKLDSIKHRLDNIDFKINKLIELRKFVREIVTQLQEENLQKIETEFAVQQEINKRELRKLQMNLIVSQLEVIKQKADELKARKEDAFLVAENLFINIQRLIDDYIKSPTDEEQALSDFTMKSLILINNAKPVLAKHRAEFIYVLTNLAIAIVLLGVGYVPAMLINKYYTGNYTFFAKTDSLQKVENLEAAVVATEAFQPVR
ncbi:MAG: hypothetical protein EPN84_09190 [Legionella sp.]|nr:MAG: hypothetical protein EPN84_09190 [Legionella sp.]